MGGPGSGRARALEARRRGAAVEPVETDAGHTLHVRRNGPVVEVIGYEVLGQLSLPRRVVPSFIEALRRAVAVDES